MTIKEHVQALISCDFSDNFPEALPVGHFTSNQAIVFPDFIGKKTKNICFYENENNRSQVYFQLEYFVLSILAQLSPSLVKLYVVDLGETLSVKNLNQIGNLLNNIELIRNFKQVEQLLIRLEERTREIQSKYLSNSFKDISEFNSSESFNKANFEFVVYVDFPIGIETFANFNKIKCLIQFQSHCGVNFFCVFSEKHISKILVDNTVRNGHDIKDEIDIMLKSMITVFNKNGQYVIDKPRLSSLNQNNLSYDFFPFHNIDFYKIIELIKIKTEKIAFNSNLNFIEIPVGLEGNNEIQIKLGDASNIIGVALCGSNGSGKSTFITNFLFKLVEKYNYDEVRLLILDYTDSEEYKIFKDIPNVELLSLTKNVWEKGFNQMIQIVERTVKERVNLYSEASLKYNKSINNLSEYYWVTNHKLPAYLIVIDEGAKLINKKEAISIDAPNIVNPYLAKILKKYRKFGINLMFATQTYADTNFTALGQIKLRIGFHVALPEDCQGLFYDEKPLGIDRYYALFNDNFGRKSSKILKSFPPINNIIEQISKYSEKNINLNFERYILTDSEESDILEIQMKIKENKSLSQIGIDSLNSI